MYCFLIISLIHYHRLRMYNMTYVSSFGLARYYYLLDRDDIFSKCPKLQVFFINPDERLYYDWNKVEVIRRLEFTREELDSCGWTIVYE